MIIPLCSIHSDNININCSIYNIDCFKKETLICNVEYYVEIVPLEIHSKRILKTNNANDDPTRRCVYVAFSSHNNAHNVR